MAAGYGAYDYKDYYKPIRGSQLEDTTPMVDKLRAMFSMFGVDQTPVDMNNPNASIGEKLRGGLGLAPARQPTAVQADVRKSDSAMTVPGVPNFGAVPATSAPAQFTPVATGASQSQVRASDNAIAANSVPIIDGKWAAPHGASPGIGAQLEAGPATPSVSSSRDANGNLVLTNAPPGPADFGASPSQERLYRPKPGGFGAAYAASMNQVRAAGAGRAAQDALLKLPEILKTTEETKKLTEINRLAAAEPDPEKRRLILSGLQAPSSAPYTFIPGMKEGEVFVGNKQTGKAVTERAAMAPTKVSFAQAKAQAMKNPQYKFTTDAKLRSDIIASGLYDLTD